ncbi:MAG: TVP38/TMEM64 family protein [Arenicellales bacterium]|nr:TVP38/TMEM64 family protein [Arenicellales bacterium]
MGNARTLKQQFYIGLIFVLLLAVVFLSVAAISGLYGWDSWTRLWAQFSIEEFEHLIESWGPWGVFAAIGLMIVHSFVPFPAEFVAIANGMIYGTLWGTVITWVGAMLGAFLSFGLTRMFGRPFVNKMLSNKRLQTVDNWVAHHGGKTLLLSRFIPVISFNLINYAAGLTRLSWWTFAWATGLGILPLTTIMVIMGDQMDTLPWYAWVLLVAAGVALWILAHYLSKSKNEGKLT